MYGGGDDEAAAISEELDSIQRQNWQRTLQSSWMSYITGNLDNFTGILPLVICAPAYFNGSSQLGMLQQARALRTLGTCLEPTVAFLRSCQGGYRCRPLLRSRKLSATHPSLSATSPP
jgi:ABC-type uncharacterized transport system fused permease/ATPase subunit